jgi:chromosome segregation ATPase
MAPRNDTSSHVTAHQIAHAGRLIDEQEKQRCALLMQFKGSIPSPSAQLTPAGRAKVAAVQARTPMASTALNPADAAIDRIARQRAALQQRFEEVEQEVAEREEFVSSMQGLGRLQQEQLAAMRAEAAAKVQEMRQLDGQIRSFDAQLRRAYSHD